MVSCWNQGLRALHGAADGRIAQLVIVPVVQAGFRRVEGFEASSVAPAASARPAKR